MIGNITVGVISTKASFEPTDIANCKLWLDAADTSTISLSGSDVTQWNDKSGNAYHFTQGTSASRPKSGTRTLNSKNVLDFDGTNDFLVSNQAASVWKFLHDTTKCTVFTVHLSDSYSVRRTVLGTDFATSTDAGAAFMYFNANTTPVSGAGNGSTGQTVVYAEGATMNTGTAYYSTSLLDPGNATAANRGTIYRNGANATSNNTYTATATSNNPVATLRVGATYNGTNVDNLWFWDGYIGEIIIYSGNLSAGELTKVHTYLAAKWAL